MATVTITIPNADLATVVNALTPDWTVNVIDESGQTVPNPINQNEWARRKVIKLVKAEVKKYKEQLATGSAAQTIENARIAAVNEANAIAIT